MVRNVERHPCCGSDLVKLDLFGFMVDKDALAVGHSAEELDMNMIFDYLEIDQLCFRLMAEIQINKKIAVVFIT